MTEETNSLPQLNIEDLKTIIPKLRSSHDKALAVTRAVTQVESEDEYSEVETLCARLKITYDDVSYPLYRKLAEPVESILDQARELISPFDYKSKKDNEYNRLRGLLAAYKQRELDKKKAIEAEAARKRERENYLVDLKTGILKALNNLVTEKVRKAETGSAEYFAASTPDDFDKRAEDYKKMKPKLKPEDWEACFLPSKYERDEAMAAWYKDLIEQESFDKWNTVVMEQCTPIINAWRAKIPDLKQEMLERKKLADDKEALEKLELEQKRKAQQEAARREAEIAEQNKKQQLEIETQASLDKMSNSFAEQAATQVPGMETGPVKYVLKFNDPKKVPKALATIIYHCMSHPDFPGIQKRDKSKKPVVDAQGRPEYIDAIQYWINLFLSKCDAEIDGTDVFEDSKVIIRK